MNIFTLYDKIKQERVGDTIQPDGRCDYRESKGNRSERSFSQHSDRQEGGVIHGRVPAVTDLLTACGRHQSPLKGCLNFVRLITLSKLLRGVRHV